MEQRRKSQRPPRHSRPRSLWLRVSPIEAAAIRAKHCRLLLRKSAPHVRTFAEQKATEISAAERRSSASRRRIPEILGEIRSRFFVGCHFKLWQPDANAILSEHDGYQFF